MTTEALKGAPTHPKDMYCVICVVCAKCNAEGPRVSGTFNAGGQSVLVDQAISAANSAGWEIRGVFRKGGLCGEWRCPAHKAD